MTQNKKRYRRNPTLWINSLKNYARDNGFKFKKEDGIFKVYETRYVENTLGNDKIRKQMDIITLTLK